MRWRKLGLLHVPDGSKPWAKTHAMLPSPLDLGDGTVRLYLAHADDGLVSRVGYIDVSTGDPTTVLKVADAPVLEIGEAGMFDDNGVNASCVVRVGDRLRMYYVGYQLQKKIPYTLFTGLAEADHADGPFRRASAVPILDRRADEPFFRTAPFVLQDGGRWRMWYIGGGRWTHVGGRLQPIYSLMETSSPDGVDWSAPSRLCLEPDLPDEIGFGRPFVVVEEGLYRLWYSIRKPDGYALGYAVSADGSTWARQDAELGIERSQSGWDSQMICYSAIVKTPGALLMFYNGNQFGRTGVGVAVRA